MPGSLLESELLNILGIGSQDIVPDFKLFVATNTEMEFNKRLETRVFCSMLFTVFSGFKNPYKKIRESRELESIHGKHFV